MAVKIKETIKILGLPILLILIVFNQGCSPTSILATGGSSAMVVAEGERSAIVPVFGHLEGICHIYVDEHADDEKALAVCLNAKMRRTGICGAVETILVNNKIAGSFVPKIVDNPKSTILKIKGFATIKKGITLSTAISDNKFQGTATDADALGGVTAANYFRSNANDTTSGTVTVANDGGIIVGTDSDLTITVDSGGAIISNVVQDTDITFKVNDGGTTTTLMTLDGSESRVGIGTTTPTTKLDVSGTVNATAFTGPISGAVTGNVVGNVTGTVTGSSSLNLLLTGGTLTGTVNTQTLIPTANNTYNLGSTSNKYANLYATTHHSTSADLAEIYESDADYEVGTVVIFGGEKEITVSNMGSDPRIAGVISENPAYVMNTDSTGLPVALMGKVKCKVVGMINKGDMLVTHSQHSGVARKANDPGVGTVIGKALEEYDSTEIGTINIVVGRC